MNYQGDIVTDINIAYIGGGSRGWAWVFMTELALEPGLSGTVRLYDTDMEAAKSNEAIGNNVSRKKEAISKWRYETAFTMREALTGADFVVISVLPGTFEEMEVDVHMPERYGIYQSVGDTTGPGGIIRALRTLPMFVEIANAIKAFCPKAWVINYTNPMSLCVKTLYHVFPKIKAFGCCHEVFGTQQLLKGIFEKETGNEVWNRNEILVNVLGINHFTWFDYASYKGIDLIPVYKEYVAKHFEEGFEEEADWKKDFFACSHRVKFDLFNKYGLIAAAGDRHLAEFMPGDTYLLNPETVDYWRFALTPVSWRKKELQERLEKSKRLACGEEALDLTPTGEEGVLMIKALCGLNRMIGNVNVPNSYLQIRNLPKSAIVETNAIFEGDRIHPIAAGKIPEGILNFIRPQADNHERILKAALERNINLVYEAFKNDTLINGRLNNKEIKSLVNDMLKGTSLYLPHEWQNSI
ncbi:alpha-galactosidase [Ruminiclostridium sufflavum DSM 19573]|uniref:Alpha-galactosidase n=1 Tax=Ruminiclostridium sufflavum DSM 19573 TaxID=1121337 RepID=A0A318XL99_9FIRM|nr:alpha-glucosidase/alpha-galactosidase [Ruminiclostridium sufflavum]PYG87341.1 alpha-galactosidase [Ruminiclostridium sufflavum DSM 19573]